MMNKYEAYQKAVLTLKEHSDLSNEDFFKLLDIIKQKEVVDTKQVLYEELNKIRDVLKKQAFPIFVDKDLELNITKLDVVKDK